MCRWDGDALPDPCVFQPPRGTEEALMRLQMAVVSVAITLPLLKFASWIFDAYLFAPTRTARGAGAHAGDGGDFDGDFDAAIRDEEVASVVAAGRQLLRNLRIDVDEDPHWERDGRLTRLLDRAFGGSAASREVRRARTAERVAHAFAGVARWQAMRLVLRQRQEISHWPASAGSLLQGFELHRGSSQAHGSCQPLCPEAPELGWVHGSVAGTYLHGVFDNGPWRRHWLNQLRQRRQLPPLPLDQPHHGQQRDLLLDRLADAFEAHVNLEPLLTDR